MANGGHLEFSNLQILGAVASMEFTLHVHVACQICCKSDIYRLEAIHVFVKFKMAVGGHLKFSRMLFLSILACSRC